MGQGLREPVGLSQSLSKENGLAAVFRPWDSQGDSASIVPALACVPRGSTSSAQRAWRWR